MMGLTRCFFLLLLKLLFIGFCSAQNSSSLHLDKLDSLAFSDLENNSENTLSSANKLLNESLKGNPSKYQINAYTLLGIINKNRGFYVSSLNYYLQALNIAELLKDKGRISACLNNIGSIYELQEEFEKAITYFEKSSEIEKTLGNPLQQSIRYYNLGECYKKIKKYDIALNYYTTSLVIEKKRNNTEGIVYAELGLADLYMCMNRLDDAKIFLQNTKNRIKTGQVSENIILHKLNAKHKLLSNDNQAALDELKLCENLSKKHFIYTNLLEVMELQISIFEKNQDWERASSKYKQFFQEYQKMNSLEVKNQLDDLKYRNEIAKKQLEIDLLQEEKDLAVSNRHKENNLKVFGQKIVVFVTFLLFSSIAMLVFGVRRLKRIEK